VSICNSNAIRVTLQRLDLAVVHRLREQPGAVVAHSHPPPLGGYRPGFRDGFEKRSPAVPDRDRRAEQDTDSGL
jgi:hypothetical protein